MKHLIILQEHLSSALVFAIVQGCKIETNLMKKFHIALSIHYHIFVGQANFEVKLDGQYFFITELNTAF